MIRKQTLFDDTSLVCRIENYRSCITPKDVPDANDRWLLASSLQKSVRRGLPQIAVATASKLLTVDPKYFWRRLLVIAYEDIGYADISLVHDLLKTFRREALCRELGAERVAGYFVHELAHARKSRSLCDAIAMLEFSVYRPEYEQRCFALTDDQLVDAVCDDRETAMNRVAALRHLCGYREAAYGSYRMITPARTELMREVYRRLQLTEIESTLFLSGQNTAESMNVPLPLVATMVRNSQEVEQQATQRFTGKAGILYAALDRHTRLGKRCIARFACEVDSVKQFFDIRPAVKPVAALGSALFIVEGAVLDHWLMFDGADRLRQSFNHNFLEYAGIAGGDQRAFLSLVMDNLAHLNRIRAQELG